jgi:hypothetical protein
VASGILPDASIITINDVEDPHDELLNKTNAIADIIHFFKGVLMSLVNPRVT